MHCCFPTRLQFKRGITYTWRALSCPVGLALCQSCSQEGHTINVVVSFPQQHLNDLSLSMNWFLTTGSPRRITIRTALNPGSNDTRPDKRVTRIGILTNLRHYLYHVSSNIDSTISLSITTNCPAHSTYFCYKPFPNFIISSRYVFFQLSYVSGSEYPDLNS